MPLLNDCPESSLTKSSDDSTSQPRREQRMPCGHNPPRSFIGAACCGPALMMAKKGCKESESHKSVSAPKGTSLLDETHRQDTGKPQNDTECVQRSFKRWEGDGWAESGERGFQLHMASLRGLSVWPWLLHGTEVRIPGKKSWKIRQKLISCHDLVSEVTWCHFLNITGPPSPARRKKLRPSTLSGQSVNIPLQQAPIGGRSHCSHRGECDLPIAKSFLDKDVKLKDKSDSRAQGGRESEE